MFETNREILSWCSYNRTVSTFMFGLVQSLIGNFHKVCGILGKFRIEFGYAKTDRHIKILSFVLKSLTGHFFPDSLSNIDPS